jgi:flagellar motor switch/type III secretory pathway protein FliN
VGSTTINPNPPLAGTPTSITQAVSKEPSPGKVLPWLPCTLALEVAVVGFTVGSLLALGEGSLVQTACHQSTDIPLQVNGILMAWTEFEVVGERLAARITDLV